MTPTAPFLPRTGHPRSRAIHRWTACLHRLLPHDVLALAQRLGIAGVFWLSGRTKVDAHWRVTDSAYTLFREEYRVPLLPPELAAQMAAMAEHLLPVLLVLGLATRLSALGLLGMTAVIQVFVYPDAWATHLSWAALLLPLVAQGGGRLSLDHGLARLLQH